eukprot:scaffold55964_cov19-Tisochrysis_lutea.AAC.1
MMIEAADDTHNTLEAVRSQESQLLSVPWKRSAKKKEEDQHMDGEVARLRQKAREEEERLVRKRSVSAIPQ